MTSGGTALYHVTPPLPFLIIICIYSITHTEASGTDRVKNKHKNNNTSVLMHSRKAVAFMEVIFVVCSINPLSLSLPLPLPTHLKSFCMVLRTNQTIQHHFRGHATHRTIYHQSTVHSTSGLATDFSKGGGK